MIRFTRGRFSCGREPHGWMLDSTCACEEMKEKKQTPKIKTMTHVLKWSRSGNRQQSSAWNQTGYRGGRCQQRQSLGLLWDLPCRTKRDVREGKGGALHSVCTFIPLYSREKESIHFPIQPKESSTRYFRPSTLTWI